MVAAQAALAAPADGYTLLLVNSQHIINPFVHKALPYDTLRDFAGVALVAEAPAVVVVSSKLGVRTLKEFIALAKQKPGSIHYASGGIGSQTHLAGAYFASERIDIMHIPGWVVRRDSGPADRARGSDVRARGVRAVVGQDGRLVALAVTSKRRCARP